MEAIIFQKTVQVLIEKSSLNLILSKERRGNGEENIKDIINAIVNKAEKKVIKLC